MPLPSFQRAVSFFTQRPLGRAIATIVGSVLLIALVRGCSSKPTIHEMTVSPTQEPGGEIRRESERVIPSPVREPLPVKTVAVKPAEVLPPISLYTSPSKEALPPPPQILMPTGRMLSCRLVNTVDSSSLDTPVIALVTEDLWFGKRLIIPKGTEVIGRAQSDRLRDRVAAQGVWTLVMPTGEELTVSAIALDQDHVGETWGVTDGTAGLRGSVHKADNLEEMKLFLATFLGGLAEPFKQRQTTVFGSQIAPTAQNAALTGVGEVILSYSAQVLRTIESQAVFVRVPAGKAFWLFTTQPLTRPLAKTQDL